MTSWEERMAQRARERADQRIEIKTHPVEFENADSWLNGWGRIADGDSTLIGTGVHCVGCGFFYGITTVYIPEGWRWPERMPDYPFTEADCPGWHNRPSGETR
jgi:hypothetical protein